MLRIHFSHGHVLDGFDLLKLAGHPDLGWTVEWYLIQEADHQGATQGGPSHEGVDAQQAPFEGEGGASVPQWRRACMSLSRMEFHPSDSSNDNDEENSD